MSFSISYLRRKGYKRYTIPDTCPECYTVGQFADDHPSGTYILATGSHAVTVQDGTVFDSYDSTVHFDSDSEFARAIQGMNSDKAWALVDELVATLWAVNKPLYNALMRQIKA